ncbi:nitrate- and nitrite sensing domain-containing protein [Streptomyces sp. ME03-5709C]|nr:nitrate- and nitrite sensing domain-containing protein [Streptomyces sp. ME03-5709C]
MTPPRGRGAHAGPPAADEESSWTDGVRGGGTRRRLSLRPRSVRAKIVSLLMVPVVSLMALWAFAAVTTAQDVSARLRAQRIAETVRGPVADTASALQAERRAATRYLARPTAGAAAELSRRATATDRAAAALRLGDGHTVADGTGLPGTAAVRIRTFVGDLERLRRARSGITRGAADWREAFGSYTGAIADGFSAGASLATSRGERAALELGRAAEQLSREDALLAAAALTGDLPADRYRDLSGAVTARRVLLESATTDLGGRSRTAWERLARSTAYQDLEAMEDAVLDAGPGKAAADVASPEAWDRVAAQVLSGLEKVAVAAPAEQTVAKALLSTSGVAVLLGLLAVVASLFISVRIGRGLVVELIGLRNTALELARRKLPRAMRRLRAGEEIDLGKEAPLRRYGADEIDQVAEALATVQRAALRAAAERAELVDGVSGVFVNLARRSQVLVHRQLALLDGMERRTEDPGELEDLFRLDHLTTRMRRHAEGLIILSGSAPGRAWSRPVPLTDVVRAAVAEVEDYARVEVRRLPLAAVVGSAVADLTHLIAELVENATQFSPPHTKVRVYGEQVGNGYALEIEDRGLGMGKEAMAEANRRIAQAQALDLFDSDRLGLFVVSRLARRHDVRVSLRSSPYGGTTAVVLLPTALLDTRAPEARAPQGTGTGGAASGPREPRPGSLQVPPTTAASPLGENDGLPRSSAPRPVPAPGPAAPPASARGGAPAPAGTPVAGAATTGGLPRRVRRASLAPQLLQPRAPERTSGPPDPGHGAPERTAEQARTTMAAYRRGWIRGGGAAARDSADAEFPGTRPPRPGAEPGRAGPASGAPGHRDGSGTARTDGGRDHARTTDLAPREGDHA